MRRLRISAISFLNTAPLMWDFNQGKPPVPGQESTIHGPLEVSYTVPSRCAEELAAGQADIGIIPAITYASIPDLVILPDAAIAATEAVRSILMVSRKPLDEVRTVAADTSSRTSVVLAEVLFRKYLGGPRKYEPMEPDLEAMLRQCDAALLIGDPALRVPLQAPGYLTFDLAQMWRHHTGLPFVFAFWAIRAAALKEAHQESDLAQVFRSSRDHGLEPRNIDAIVRAWAPHVRIAAEEARRYLTQHIHYYLDENCLRGLEFFFSQAADCGLISGVPKLRFAGGPVPVAR